jgi:CRP-like cAMP-binding protein
MYELADIPQRVKTYFEREEIPARTLLVKEGAVATKIYFIDQGCCRTWFNHDGRDVTFQFIFENQFASSFESVKNNARSWYSIETLEPVVAYTATVERMQGGMELYPHIKELYYKYIENGLLIYQQLFASHIKNSPEKRYQELLEHYPEIVKRVPQHYIASYLGITSVSLSRIRNRR